MEDFNLESLSLFLSDEIIVIKEEMAQQALAQKFKSNHTIVNNPEPNPVIEDDASAYKDVNEIIKQLEGGYEKRIIIIYEGSTLEKEHQEFIMKILGAVSCSLKDIALIGSDQLENMDSSVLEQMNPSKIIVFGLVHHPIMQYKVDLYKIRDVGYELLFVDDLVEISNKVPLKKLLWASLQTLFNINK